MVEQATILAEDLTEGKASSPPYVSYLTFKNCLTWLESDGIPYRFDRSAWEKKFSGSIGPQLLTGLRFLGLLDGERPTSTLERLIGVNGEERNAMLVEIIKASYGRIDFSALDRATPNMLREWMAGYGLGADTSRKAESFFVNAAKDLDIPLSAGLKKVARNRPTQAKSGAQVTTRRTPRRTQEPPAGKPTTPSTTPDETYEADAQQSLMLWGLFKRLPAPGSEFSRSERDAWIRAAQTLFDLEYTEEEIRRRGTRLNTAGDQETELLKCNGSSGRQNILKKGGAVYGQQQV